MKNAYILQRKPDDETLGRSRRRRKDNIKIDLKINRS
jgi:hypothetical protein